jgi:hypothetical protein
LTYLSFITEGKLAAVLITPSLGVPNWPVIYIINTAPPTSFLAPLRRKRRLLQGEFRTHIFYFVLSFALIYFCLHRLFKNTKKLVFFIVVTLLLLVHYVVP